MACDNCDNPHTCNDDDLIGSLRNLYYYSCFLDSQCQSVTPVILFLMKIMRVVAVPLTGAVTTRLVVGDFTMQAP